jgi:hypothetical protein
MKNILKPIHLKRISIFQQSLKPKLNSFGNIITNVTWI